jgi:hypothetical protein
MKKHTICILNQETKFYIFFSWCKKKTFFFPIYINRKKNTRNLFLCAHSKYDRRLVNNSKYSYDVLRFIIGIEIKVNENKWLCTAFSWQVMMVVGLLIWNLVFIISKDFSFILCLIKISKWESKKKVFRTQRYCITLLLRQCSVIFFFRRIN